jgi:glyoxylase-like metal-dependent hydrolase (beta-lactamase superfamily II)
MERESTVGRERLWDRVFPGLVPPSAVTAKPVPAGGLELEGAALEPVELGHTDTDETTALWVPSIGLLVAGDSIYNGVHQMILETPGGGFDSWLAAVDKIEALHPRFVVAGHKAPGASDDPGIIAETRQYLLDARRLMESAGSPREYYDEILRRYPHRVNPGPVWYCAEGLIGTTR